MEGGGRVEVGLDGGWGSWLRYGAFLGFGVWSLGIGIGCLGLGLGVWDGMGWMDGMDGMGEEGNAGRLLLFTLFSTEYPVRSNSVRRTPYSVPLCSL